ncbi:Hypoxanthine phosphoribosyltransferase [Balamuthia mandrillaris]
MMASTVEVPPRTPSPLRASKNELSQINDLEEVLHSEGAIEARIRQLAGQIDKDYEGKTILMVGILKGSVIFLTDLAKRVQTDTVLDFMAVSSYGSGTVTTGAVKILMDTRTNIEGQHVLIVEDIVDSGYTLHYLMQLLRSRNPASLECCVLLRKKERLRVSEEELKVKYVGFDIPDKWVVGYGMDYDERYRTLPFIGVLKREVYEKKDDVEDGIAQ